MARDWKGLGLILVTVFLMSSAAAPAVAQEQGELIADDSMTLDLTELAGKLNAITVFGARFECPGSTWKGHKYNVTPHEVIPGGATTTTITPVYATCHAIDGLGTHRSTTTMNECDYVAHIGKTTGVESRYSITTDISCPEGKHVQIDVYAFAGSELGGIQCTITLKPQAGLSGPTLKNIGPSQDLQIEGTFKGLSAERGGSGCSSESTSAGEWHLNTTVEGTNSLGGETGIGVVD